MWCPGGSRIKSLRKLLLGEENGKRKWEDIIKESVVIREDCDKANTLNIGFTKKIYIHIDMYVCMYVCMCVYVCIYVCMYETWNYFGFSDINIRIERSELSVKPGGGGACL